MKLALVLVVVALAVTVVPAATASKENEAKRVAVALVWANIRAQYGKVWATLHPRYQRVTTRAFWESCKRKEAAKRAGVEWISIGAIDAYADRVTLPLLGSIPVVAVTVEAKYTYLGTTRTASDTNYWAKIGGKWRGFWKPEQYRAYKAHRCPAI